MKQVLLKTSVVIAMVTATFDVRATDVEVLSARQTTPGNVLVTIALPGAALPAKGELALQLDNTPLIQAGSITSLGAPTGPAWLMLCIDRSGSIGQPVLDGLKVGLRKALVEGRTGPLPFNVAMVSFATDRKHALDFTNDPARVAAAIQGLTLDRAPDGRTRLHDAISSGLAALKGQGEGSKRLIVVSDGKDEGSGTKADDLAGIVKGPPRITIDALALGALAQDNAGAISVLAGTSGGRFLPNADVKDVAQPLQRLISDAVRLSRFEVAFGYAPAEVNRTTQLAALQYTPAGGAAVSKGLTTALVAQAPPPERVKPDSPPPPPPPPSPVEVNHRFTFEFVFNWLKNAPAALAAAAALLLAAALGVWYVRVYRHKTAVIVSSKEEVNVFVSPASPPPPRVRPPTAVGHTWQVPSPGHPVATLRGIAGTARGQMVQVDKALFRIGCDPDNDLVLVGDDFASGSHALLRFEAGAFYVEDLGSTNGTHLNGGTFKSATRVLSPGDELRLGHTTYQVLAPSPQAASVRSGLEPSPG